MSKTDDGYVHGYCDPDGNFMGFNTMMTLIPGLVPAKFCIRTGAVTFTGNPAIIPTGHVLRTTVDEKGKETVLGGMVEDVGADTAPSGSIPGTAIPDALEPGSDTGTGSDGDTETDLGRSEELANKIAARKKG